jgi:hypothetical protein
MGRYRPLAHPCRRSRAQLGPALPPPLSPGPAPGLAAGLARLGVAPTRPGRFGRLPLPPLTPGLCRPGRLGPHGDPGGLPPGALCVARNAGPVSPAS